jgi:hypothetical protein
LWPLRGYRNLVIARKHAKTRSRPIATAIFGREERTKLWRRSGSCHRHRIANHENAPRRTPVHVILASCNLLGNSEIPNFERINSFGLALWGLLYSSAAALNEFLTVPYEPRC